MPTLRVRLVPVGSVGPGLLEALARALPRCLPDCAPVLDDHPLDPGFAFDRTRGQYRSDRLLDALSAGVPGRERVVGLTEVDLFLPVFTFVFGEARLDGPAAVVSLHRLRPQAYGLPPDPPRLIARTLTEVVHELGHTFGLRHCTDFSCAMRASRAADEIDLKPPAYCRPCASLLPRRRAAF